VKSKISVPEGEILTPLGNRPVVTVSTKHTKQSTQAQTHT